MAEPKSTGFVITGETTRSPYHLAGRALVQGPDLALYITDDDRYITNLNQVRIILLLGGTVPVYGSDTREWTGERREGGRGLWICIRENRYVIPARSLLPVLEGKVRKAAIFRYEISQ